MPEDRYAELGRLVADLIDRGRAILTGAAPSGAEDGVVAGRAAETVPGCAAPVRMARPRSMRSATKRPSSA